MTRDRLLPKIGHKAAAAIALAALVLCAGPAWAQNTGSDESYRLPEPTRAPAPVPGPVDSENPTTAPARPPAAAPAQPAAPLPTITLPSAASETQPARARREAAPARGRETAAPVAAEPPPPSAAPPPAPAIEPIPTPAATPLPTAAEPESGSSLPWLIGGLVLALAALAAFLRLRKRETSSSYRAEEPDVPARAPAALPPVKPAEPQRTPLPPPLTTTDPIELLLEARSLRISFAFATLTYRLTLTNRSDRPLEALQIAADLASAHASLSPAQQLAVDGPSLEVRHRIDSLAPGEGAELTGSVQLPLGEVLTLRAGEAIYFAPLARFRIDTSPDSMGRVFTLGLPSVRRGDTMQPFRLDQGPQLFKSVEHREIDVAAVLGLDEPRRAG